MLLDTHVLIWFLESNPRLGPRTREQLAGASSVRASAVSSWELAIKSYVGKVTSPEDLVSLVERSGLSWLDISPEHTWATRDLTGLLHQDSFDRLLTAQALSLGIPLVTADRALLSATIRPSVELVDASV